MIMSSLRNKILDRVFYVIERLIRAHFSVKGFHFLSSELKSAAVEVEDLGKERREII
jgi:hypothetical protein